MKFLAGGFYGLVAIAHTAGFLDAVMTGGCVFVGTVFALYAVEHIVIKAMKPAHRQPTPLNAEQLEFMRRLYNSTQDEMP